jgi:uncharacterized membrane protein
LSRDAWLLVHVAGVVLFLGNIVVTAVWKLLADRTGDTAVVAYAQRLVLVTDVVFTATGATMIAISGPVLAERLDWPGWASLGLALFAVSGVIWAAVLIPIQVAQWRLTRRLARDAELPPRYRRLSLVWAIFGAAATVLPLANLYLMVVKPDL